MIKANFGRVELRGKELFEKLESFDKEEVEKINKENFDTFNNIFRDIFGGNE